MNRREAVKTILMSLGGITFSPLLRGASAQAQSPLREESFSTDGAYAVIPLTVRERGELEVRLHPHQSAFPQDLEAFLTIHAYLGPTDASRHIYIPLPSHGAYDVEVYHKNRLVQEGRVELAYDPVILQGEQSASHRSLTLLYPLRREAEAYRLEATLREWMLNPWEVETPSSSPLHTPLVYRAFEMLGEWEGPRIVELLEEKEEGLQSRFLHTRITHRESGGKKGEARVLTLSFPLLPPREGWLEGFVLEGSALQRRKNRAHRFSFTVKGYGLPPSLRISPEGWGVVERVHLPLPESLITPLREAGLLDLSGQFSFSTTR